MATRLVLRVKDKATRKDLKEIEKSTKDGLWNLLRRVGDASAKRIRRNVSGEQPYGTGYPDIPPIVRRKGRVYDTIGYKRERTGKDRFRVRIGAIKLGDPLGRILAAVHEGGATIQGRLSFPPFGSPARNPATGEQMYSFKEYKEQFGLKAAKEAFVFTTKVKIPARRIISRDMPKLSAHVSELLPATIEKSIRKEK